MVSGAAHDLEHDVPGALNPTPEGSVRKITDTQPIQHMFIVLTSFQLCSLPNRARLFRCLDLDSHQS